MDNPDYIRLNYIIIHYQLSTIHYLTFYEISKNSSFPFTPLSIFDLLQQFALESRCKKYTNAVFQKYVANGQ